MKAEASSVWASCCGLLNEVMGTGAVRGQQPGFGAGAGPFRFAPSSGYSTYPSNSSGNPSLVCKGCGQAFSVFRRKYVCVDCEESFCSMCTEGLRSIRMCSNCLLLTATAFRRPQLMRLRVRDLRQYLMLRNISTDTCREKEDLVDLVLFHRGIEEEEDEDDDDEEEVEDPNTASLLSHTHRTSTPSIAQPTSEPSAASLEESHSRSESPATRPDSGDLTQVSLPNLDSSGQTPETSRQTQHGARASLSDITSVRDIKDLSVRQLKEILSRNFVNYSGCCEKSELVERVIRLYREKERNIKTYGKKCPLTLQDENLCRICMDAVIDCVLLECGHLVTCTNCGKKMNQCPICRQYVVRAVHVFKC